MAGTVGASALKRWFLLDFSRLKARNGVPTIWSIASCDHAFQDTPSLQGRLSNQDQNGHDAGDDPG
ncbi:hypothetical protein AB4144_28645, partial [Rhizobiaceae sp. 2RAB30]